MAGLAAGALTAGFSADGPLYAKAAHRLALVGDAAHTIHPLAGQGVNSALWTRTESARDDPPGFSASGQDTGQHLALRRYERSRKHSAAMMLPGCVL